MEPVSLAHIVTFFEDEIKLIGCSKNAFKSTHIEQFTFEGSTGIIRCKVRSSLKDITRFYVTDEDHRVPVLDDFTRQLIQQPAGCVECWNVTFRFPMQPEAKFDAARCLLAQAVPEFIKPKCIELSKVEFEYLPTEELISRIIDIHADVDKVKVRPRIFIRS